ncbi:phage portal protein [Streptomyces sp. CC224B]|uniref:phage portal protein n=1 Tax=Streptomyces sp. CC224B TaxID=3044571 RepID=UPI0024A94A33|nr:phage portal protein [Streptomyces sp. CC224B]
MPLPDRDIAWPPTDPTVQNALADWDAWYSADPDRLGDRYLNRGLRELPENRPAQMRGGVVGRVARWFWGQPTPPGQQREKIHIPLAGDIARTSSALLFSEPPALTGANDTTQKRLDEIVEEGLHPTLLEAGELCAALGGAYLRVVWDEEVSDRPWLSAVAADSAVPEFSYGHLRAVTFWTVVHVDGQTVWRHLERHEKGRILHGLYAGTPGMLGKRRPLQDLPATEGIAPFITQDDWIDTGAPKHLTASYAPNVRPARAWRHLPAAAYWGQSDFQGIEPVMDALDEVWSSWMRDIINGKGRVVVPNSMLESLGPGQGAAWSEERRLYSGLNMLQRPGDPNPLTVVQFEIRVQEHKETCAALAAEAARQAGYSASTFGDHGEGQAVTATEIKARERRSDITRSRKTLYFDPALASATAAQLAVEAGPRFGVRGLDLAPPKVEFQDSVSEGLGELATTAELLRRAEAASTDTLVRMMHPDWDDKQVRKEVDEILGESGRAVADPFETGAEGVPHAGVPGDGGGPRG